MAYIYLMTSDGAFIVTSDGAFIVLQGGEFAGCTVPLAPEPRLGDPPPPNPVTPEEFPPSGLLGIPLTLLEMLPDRAPAYPADAPLAYDPVDRLSYVILVLAALEPL